MVIPSITHIICRNESSLNVMTNEENINISTVNHSSKVVSRKKKKNVLTNKDNNKKQKQTNKANDEIEEREYPGCNAVTFYMTCVRSVQLKNCLNKLVIMKSSNKVTIITFVIVLVVKIDRYLPYHILILLVIICLSFISKLI